MFREWQDTARRTSKYWQNRNALALGGVQHFREAWIGVVLLPGRPVEVAPNATDAGDAHQAEYALALVELVAREMGACAEGGSCENVKA